MSKQKDKCPDCKGLGRVPVKEKVRDNIYNSDLDWCPTCHGTGEKMLDRPELNPPPRFDEVFEKGLRNMDSPREKIGKAPVLKSYLVPDKTGRPDGHIAFPTLKEQRDADHLYYIALFPDGKRTGLFVPCPTCSGTGEKKLDRPELPKEIPALCIVNMVEGRGYPNCVEPLIKEAKKQSDELILEMRREYEQKLTLKEAIVTERVERQAGERIGEWLLEEYDKAPRGGRIATFETVIEKLISGQAIKGENDE